MDISAGAHSKTRKCVIPNTNPSVAGPVYQKWTGLEGSRQVKLCKPGPRHHNFHIKSMLQPNASFGQQWGDRANFLETLLQHNIWQKKSLEVQRITNKVDAVWPGSAININIS